MRCGCGNVLPGLSGLPTPPHSVLCFRLAAPPDTNQEKSAPWETINGLCAVCSLLGYKLDCHKSLQTEQVWLELKIMKKKKKCSTAQSFTPLAARIWFLIFVFIFSFARWAENHFISRSCKDPAELVSEWIAVYFDTEKEPSGSSIYKLSLQARAAWAATVKKNKCFYKLFLVKINKEYGHGRWKQFPLLMKNLNTTD